jgi:hypothetical protein
VPSTGEVAGEGFQADRAASGICPKDSFDLTPVVTKIYLSG